MVRDGQGTWLPHWTASVLAAWLLKMATYSINKYQSGFVMISMCTELKLTRGCLLSARTDMHRCYLADSLFTSLHNTRLQVLRPRNLMTSGIFTFKSHLFPNIIECCAAAKYCRIYLKMLKHISGYSWFIYFLYVVRTFLRKIDGRRHIVSRDISWDVVCWRNIARAHLRTDRLCPGHYLPTSSFLDYTMSVDCQ